MGNWGTATGRALPKVTQAATHISRIQGHKATLVVNADIQENSLNSLRTHKRAEVSANQFKC